MMDWTVITFPTSTGTADPWIIPTEQNLEAEAALKELLAAVQDEEVWQDRYNRAVAICSLATIKVASEGLDKARERKRAALAKCRALGLMEE